MSKPYFVTLPNRGLITVTGADKISFLQGLVSNDVTKLPRQKIQYSCLLTPQGKFLHDFFLHHIDDDKILIECEGQNRAADLHNRLSRYKLRSDVNLSLEENVQVFALLNAEETSHNDPRHYRLGKRVFDRPINALEEGFIEWDKERILLGIPDGSRDMVVEKSTMLECGLDKFNAIDWDKGCWMGQELTARMKYRGLGKKHLRAIQFKTPPAPAPFTPLEINAKVIGEMRSSCADIGLALIKDEYLELIKNEQDFIRILG